MSKKSLLQLHLEQHHSPCNSQGLGDTGEPEAPEKPVRVVTESQPATGPQSEPWAGLLRGSGCLSAKVDVSRCCCRPGCRAAQCSLCQRLSSIRWSYRVSCMVLETTTTADTGLWQLFRGRYRPKKMPSEGGATDLVQPWKSEPGHDAVGVAHGCNCAAFSLCRGWSGSAE